MNRPTPSPPLSHSVSSEWQHLRYASTPPPAPTPGATTSPVTPPADTHRQAYTFYAGRLSASPSLGSSPSSCPSLSSSTSSRYRRTIVEIEELDSDSDSGIEILYGEFEDAPDDYGRAPSPCPSSDDDDDSDYSSDDGEDQDGRIVLARLRRLWCANTPGSAGTARKRTHVESLDGSDDEAVYDSDSDNSSDSGSGGRIRRRKLAPSRSRDTMWDMQSSRSTPEWMMDEMEL